MTWWSQSLPGPSISTQGHALEALWQTVNVLLNAALFNAPARVCVVFLPVQRGVAVPWMFDFRTAWCSVYESQRAGDTMTLGNSLAQSESTFSPFGFRKGPKRLTFYSQVLWASEETFNKILWPARPLQVQSD